MSLGQELVAIALAYTRARLTELRDAVLADVDAFVAALGPPAATAPAILTHLEAAKAELDQAGAALDATDLVGSATHFGTAVDELDQAARAAGVVGLEPLLRSAIGWQNATPSGLAAQLGLPDDVPGLRLVDGVLIFELTAPGRTLAPVPRVAFEHLTLAARLRVDPTLATPPLSVAVTLAGAEIGIGGGPIATLLGGAGGSAQADVVLGFDTTRGLSLGGSASPKVVLPAHAGVGPLDLRELDLELPAGLPDTIDLGGTFTVDLGGVVSATVEGPGVHLHVAPGQALTGANPLEISLKAPTGIGLSLDAGIISGGGFLGVRPTGFGGALELALGPIDVKAVGLLTLEPSFALVVVMSVEFRPAIDLTFGFTLNAVGGVLGIEHRLDTDALRSRLADGALDQIMFPADPVAAAPAILDTLAAVFPFDHGSFVIGPMIELGWGRPVSFLTAQIGVLLSLPDPKIVIIGRIRLAVPAPELPIVDLRATVYGEITPDHLLVLVSLRGSRIAGFTVAGDLGLLIRWSGQAELAISAGGFHPQYQPPQELAGMERLQMDLSPPAVLTMRAEAYFAVTTNSLQLGCRVELGADLGVASITGHFSFDALVVWSPHFMFVIDLGIGLTVRAFGTTLCGVDIQLHLEGPAPWRAQGSAEVEILWWSVDIDVGPFTWGDDDNPPPTPIDARQLVFDAIDHQPGAWAALTPAGTDQLVTLVPPTPSDTEVTVHPLGLFEVRQHAVPLETEIVRVGANPVPGGRQRIHLGLPQADATDVEGVSEVTDLFSAGNFLNLTDDQKLSRPSFEPMAAGARIRPPGEAVDAPAARQVELAYETFVAVDGTADPSRFGLRAEVAETLFAFSAGTGLASGAAGRSQLRVRTRYATVPDPIVLADPGESVVCSTMTLATVGPAPTTYTHAAAALPDAAALAGLQVTRLGVG
ncbi:MAG: DUF6603 domain-containing protein [Propionibacteriaceae bacterium]